MNDPMNTPGLSRRAFLAGGLAALGGLGAAWLARGLPLPGYTDDLVVRILRRNLYYLILDDADLRAFARDVTADLDRLQTRDVRLAAYAWPLYPFLPAGFLAENPRVRNVEDEVVTRFLQSTDFFWNGADESVPVRYLGYYRPGIACFNPFLRPGANNG